MIRNDHVQLVIGMTKSWIKYNAFFLTSSRNRIIERRFLRLLAWSADHFGVS